jgi:NIMA (never in mitosis gene a)-related kinase
LLTFLVGRKDKTPLEEVKNLLAPLVRMTETHHRTRSVPDAKQKPVVMGLETPRNVAKPPCDYEASAMKGVIFTTTGESLATPAPAELVNLFVNSPKVGLNFAKIFDFGEEAEEAFEGELDSDTEGPPPSPSIRDRAKVESSFAQQQQQQQQLLSVTAPPSRLRRPSIRPSIHRPGLPASTSDPTGLTSPLKTASSSSTKTKRPSTSATASTTTTTKKTAPAPQSSPPPPEYDFSDEENLPSPFLKRVERERTPLAGGAATLRNAAGLNKRPSSGNLLRVVAAANAANANAASSGSGIVAGRISVKGMTRPSVTSARKASEEARKALLR